MSLSFLLKKMTYKKSYPSKIISIFRSVQYGTNNRFSVKNWIFHYCCQNFAYSSLHYVLLNNFAYSRPRASTHTLKLKGCWVCNCTQSRILGLALDIFRSTLKKRFLVFQIQEFLGDFQEVAHTLKNFNDSLSLWYCKNSCFLTFSGVAYHTCCMSRREKSSRVLTTWLEEKVLSLSPPKVSL